MPTLDNLDQGDNQALGVIQGIQGHQEGWVEKVIQVPPAHLGRYVDIQDQSKDIVEIQVLRVNPAFQGAQVMLGILVLLDHQAQGWGLIYPVNLDPLVLQDPKENPESHIISIMEFQVLMGM